MNLPKNNNSRNTILIYVAYLATLMLFIVGAILPDSRLWGVSFGAFVPSPLSIALFVFACIVLFLSYRLAGQSVNSINAEDKKFTLFALFTSLAFVTGWILLRARTYFLGDGYTLLKTLANNEPIIKNREIGESLFHLWLKQILPASPDTAALLSFQIISIGSGFLFLIVLTIVTKKLFDSQLKRCLFWLGSATGGYTLLYFGYVEYYSLLMSSVAVFILVGLLIAKSMLDRWFILMPLALAIFFHSIAVALIPGALYLVLTSDEKGILFKSLSRKLKIFLLLLSAVLSLSISIHFYTSNFFLKLAIIPILENKITAEGYTLFSISHLVDIANQLLLLFPGILVVVCAILLNKNRKTTGRDIRFLLIAALSTMGAIFVLDPRLGMPRDWDLFAFAGMPIVIGCYYYLLTNTTVFTRVGILAIGLGMISIIGRATVLSDTQAGIAQFKSYISLDKIKNRNGQAILVIYYQDIDDRLNYTIEEQRRHELYPQIRWVDSSKAFIERGRSDLAYPLLTKAISVDPLYWNAWINLGAYYLQRKQFDSAQFASNIAVGLNPFNLEAQSQTAYSHYYLKQHDEAEEIWLDLLSKDSTHSGALVGMANLSYARKNKPDYYNYIRRAASQPDALPVVVAQLGYFYIGEKDYSTAAKVFRRALARGLDPTRITSLFDIHPQLAEEMPELVE